MDITKFTSQFQNLDLSKDFSGVRLPEIILSDEDYASAGLKEKVSNYDFLLALVRNGYRQKKKDGVITDANQDLYVKRIKYELDILNSLKFVDYVLIVWDVINFCKKNKIPTGLGRGSCCGCLLFYLLGVTGIDSIKYNLLFERFISPSRCGNQEINGEVYLTGTLPDVDLDISFMRRAEVVEYLKSKYPLKTAKILNLSTLTGKSLIKESGKIVYGKNETEMNKVSNLIPTIFGKVQDIEKVYEENKEFKSWCDENPLAYKIALKLRGLIKNKSVHASGLVIGRDEITDCLPVEMSKGENELVCSMKGTDVSEVLIKLDLLGLKTLSVIEGVCVDSGIEMKDINFEDPDIYKFISNSDCYYGLFQIEADTALNVTKRLKPENLGDLSAIMALARPGAMKLVGNYIDAKLSGETEEIHPDIDPILVPTFGQIIYQEQLMLIANKIGFSLEEGYKIIKIIGKKQTDEVKKWESKIYDTAAKNGVSKEVATIVWKSLLDSSDYSFNAAHSYSYAAMCAITAYLKMKYPLNFFLHCLRMALYETDSMDCITRISNEMTAYGYKIYPPSLVKANEDFIIDNNGVRFGLSAIKGVAGKTIEKLKKFNGDEPNKFSLFQSANNSKIGIGVLCCLIQIGAISDFGENRSLMVLEAQLWNLLTDREKEYCLENGREYDFDLIKMVQNLGDWKDVDGKQFTRNTRTNTIRKKYEPFKMIYDRNSAHEDFAAWYYENYLMGFAYSTSLKKVFSKACNTLSTIREVSNAENRSNHTFIGVVKSIQHARTKKGDMYSKLLASDETGQVLCFIFEPNRTRLIHEKKKNLPIVGDVMAFRGNKSGELFTLYDYSLQSDKIYMKLSELKADIVDTGAESEILKA